MQRDSIGNFFGYLDSVGGGFEAIWYAALVQGPVAI